MNKCPKCGELKYDKRGGGGKFTEITEEKNKWVLFRVLKITRSCGNCGWQEIEETGWGKQEIKREKHELKNTDKVLLTPDEFGNWTPRKMGEVFKVYDHGKLIGYRKVIGDSGRPPGGKNIPEGNLGQTELSSYEEFLRWEFKK